MSEEKENPAAEKEQQAQAAEAAAETEDSALAKLQGDMERFKDLALRSEADLQNFRKRAAREKEDALKYANSAFLERLIPILDNFDMGMAAARSDKNSAILTGLEMVAKQFQDFLTDTGVQPIEAVGQKFDPNLHEAIAQEASKDVPEGHVTKQVRKGYRLKDRLLRPANVIVSKGAK
jgi:molecular chaperone GrpE